MPFLFRFKESELFCFFLSGAGFEQFCQAIMLIYGGVVMQDLDTKS